MNNDVRDEIWKSGLTVFNAMFLEPRISGSCSTFEVGRVGALCALEIVRYGKENPEVTLQSWASKCKWANGTVEFLFSDYSFFQIHSTTVKSPRTRNQDIYKINQSTFSFILNTLKESGLYQILRSSNMQPINVFLENSSEILQQYNLRPYEFEIFYHTFGAIVWNIAYRHRSERSSWYEAIRSEIRKISPHNNYSFFVQSLQFDHIPGVVKYYDDKVFELIQAEFNVNA